MLKKTPAADIIFALCITDMGSSPCSTGGTVITVARRVYVGNLDWSVTWQDLKDHFRSVGNGMLDTQSVVCRPCALV